MKTLLKKLSACAVGLIMLFAVCGCGSPEPSELIPGTWSWIQSGSYFDLVCSYEFEADGNCTQLVTTEYQGNASSIEKSGTYEIDTESQLIDLVLQNEDEGTETELFLNYEINDNGEMQIFDNSGHEYVKQQ